jgi:hypothetical protein
LDATERQKFWEYEAPNAERRLRKKNAEGWRQIMEFQEKNICLDTGGETGKCEARTGGDPRAPRAGDGADGLDDSIITSTPTSSDEAIPES